MSSFFRVKLESVTEFRKPRGVLIFGWPRKVQLAFRMRCKVAVVVQLSSNDLCRIRTARWRGRLGASWTLHSGLLPKLYVLNVMRPFIIENLHKWEYYH